MSIFASSDEVYAALGGFVEELAASPGFGPMLEDVGHSLQLNLTEPTATIEIRHGPAGLTVVLDENDGSPSAVMALPSTTLHQVLLLQDSFTGALSRGELEISEEVKDFAPLVAPLAFAAFPRYEDHLRDLGRLDLL